MSSVETVSMSSKGQIVIPQHLREELHVAEGSVFAVFGSTNTIILKKVELPSKEELIKDLTVIAKEGKRRLQRRGLSERDIPRLVTEARGRV